MQQSEKIPVEASSTAVCLQEIQEEINSLIDTKRTSKSQTAQERIKHWLEQVENEQEVLLADQKKVQAMRGQWHLAFAELDKFEAWCASERENLDAATYQEKRTALEILEIKVHVFKVGENPVIKLRLNHQKFLKLSTSC